MTVEGIEGLSIARLAISVGLSKSGLFAHFRSKEELQLANPGPVRDRAFALVAEWFGQLEAAARAAQAEGSVEPDEDPTQIAFELDAYLLFANAQYVASSDADALDRARQAIAGLLRSISTSE